MNDLEQKIEHILADLYKIDPAFRQHEAKVKTIIKEVLLAKPDTKFDEQFAAALRHKLLTQADMLKEKNGVSLLHRVGFLTKISYALGTVAVVAIIAAAGILYLQNRKNVPQQADLSKPGNLLSSKIAIDRIGSQAFGKLALNSINTTAPQSGGNGENATSLPAGRQDLPADSGATGSGSSNSNTLMAPAAPSPKTALGLGGGGTGGFMPPYISYKYVYKGGDFTVDKDQMEVYKRQPTAANIGAADLLKRLNFGAADLGTFDNLTVQNLTLAEDKEFGYMFYANLQDSSLDISRNWDKWPQPATVCQSGRCAEPNQLKISDIPADQAIIDIADQFLKQHNIPTDIYGAPQMQNSWRQIYAETPDKSQFYVPDILTVIYPLKINGTAVSDESGSPIGLMVSVDVRTKIVASVSGLASQNYDSSLYPVETDAKRLIQMAENGGFRGVYPPSGNSGNASDIELGTPTQGLVKLWQYQQDKNQSVELIVPALIFPVTKAPIGQYFYQKNVIIPLPKDLLQQVTVPPSRIMPAPAQ